jgi:hypothetical protein
MHQSKIVIPQDGAAHEATLAYKLEALANGLARMQSCHQRLSPAKLESIISDLWDHAREAGELERVVGAVRRAVGG